MNILKLAKHLKEFTLDEISMIAEFDVETEINQLLNEKKLICNNGLYKYCEPPKKEYDVFTVENHNYKNITLESAIEYFLKNYVKIYCKTKTYRTYSGTFKFDILPFFKNKALNDIEVEDIRNFYLKCQEWDFKPRRIKNTLALLNQLIKYFQNQCVIDKKCVFQVKRLTAKTEFHLNNLVIGKERGIDE